MKIKIHRGTHQIGGTCIEISTEKARIIFDIGEELTETDSKNTNLQINDLFFDSPTTNKKIDAVFISHNHGDHIGLIQKVRKEIPIFIGETAKEIQNTIAKFIPDPIVLQTENYLKNGKLIQIKDVTITPFLIDHSAYDAYSFVIEANSKKVIYTGDFRNHGLKGALTVKFSKNPISQNADVLIIEGTNLYKTDFVAEKEVDLQKRIEDYMIKTIGNVFVLQSSANIDRLGQIFKAALHTNRLFVIDIFTAHILMKLPDSFPKPSNCEKMKIFYPMYLTDRMFKLGENELMNSLARYKISKEELKERTNLCILVRESMMFDITNRMNISNSTLIYSKWTGYKKDASTKRFIDTFLKNGLEVDDFHTSGHADIPTIIDFVENCKPKHILPVHTITPEKYVELFGEKVILANDNDMIVI